MVAVDAVDVVLEMALSPKLCQQQDVKRYHVSVRGLYHNLGRVVQTSDSRPWQVPKSRSLQ